MNLVVEEEDGDGETRRLWITVELRTEKNGEEVKVGVLVKPIGFYFGFGFIPNRIEPVSIKFG